MPDELERLQINIEADASGVAPAAAQAKQAMSGVGSAAKKMQQLLKNAMQGMRSSVRTVTDMTSKSIKQTTAPMAKVAQEMSRSTQGTAQAVSTIRAQLENVTRVYEAQIEKAAALENKIAALNKMLADARGRATMYGRDTATDAGVVSAQEKLAQAKTQYARVVQQIDAAAQKMWELEDAANGAADGVQRVGEDAERSGAKTRTIFSSIGSSLRSMLIIRTVSSAIRSMIGWLGSAVMADKQVSASLAQVKGNLLTAFAPIYSAVIPAIRALMGWLSSLTARFAQFMMAITGWGASDAQKVASQLDGIGGSAGGASKQVKELLGSFDELNKLDRTESSGGGGGGGSSIDYSALFGDMAYYNKISAAKEQLKITLRDSLNEALEDSVNAVDDTLSDRLMKSLVRIGNHSAEYKARLKKAWEELGATIKGSLSGAIEDETYRADDSLSKRMAKIVVHVLNWKSNLKGAWGELKETVSTGLASAIEDETTAANDTLNERIAKIFVSIVRWGTNIRTSIGNWFRSLPGKFANWIDENALSPIREAWEEVEQWAAQNVILSKLFGLDENGDVATIDVNTQPAETSLNALNLALDAINGKKVKAAVKVDTDVTTTSAGVISKYVTGSTTTSSTKSNWSALVPNFSGTWSTIKKALGFASGGLNIPSGQLFIANESGAEMVGQIGGKTAVANQNEISGAIWREMQKYRNESGGASAQEIADAVAEALNGVAVKVGERQLGEITVRAINKNKRQAGRVDFAF